MNKHRQTRKKTKKNNCVVSQLTNNELRPRKKVASAIRNKLGRETAAEQERLQPLLEKL